MAQTFKAEIEDVGGYYRLSYTINSNKAENFRAPYLEDAFKVLSGPSTSTFSNYQIINGHASSSSGTTYTYILAPRKSGKITIPAASAQVEGKTVKSNVLTIHTSASGNTSSSGNPRQQSHSSLNDHSTQQAGTPVTNHDLFIDCTPSRTKVFEQEAILLTYRIHSKAGVALANVSLAQKPDFKGVISQEIPLPGNQIVPSIENRGGVTYKSAVVLQYVVFPQKSGKLTIPGMTFACTVVQQDHDMDLADAFFNGGGTIGVEVNRHVAPITLQVEPLPQPKPAGFSEAVGKFDIKAKVLNPTVRTNDIGTYRITLSGLGNLKLITAPKVAFPKDFDTYDAKTEDYTKTTTSGLHGELVFDYTFVPRNVGKYTIPATEFVYFDTNTNSYQTLRTNPITLDVKQGANTNSDVDKQLALLQNDIRPFRQAKPVGVFDWGTTGFNLIVLALILLFAGLIWLIRRYLHIHADTAGLRKRNAGRQASALIATAQKMLQSPDKGGNAFYRTVNQSVQGFLADKYGLQYAEMTNENIRQRLKELKVEDNLIERLLSLIDTCQFAQYAPSGQEDRKKVYQDAVNIITDLSR